MCAEIGFWFRPSPNRAVFRYQYAQLVLAASASCMTVAACPGQGLQFARLLLLVPLLRLLMPLALIAMPRMRQNSEEFTQARMHSYLLTRGGPALTSLNRFDPAR